MKYGNKNTRIRTKESGRENLAYTRQLMYTTSSHHHLSSPSMNLFCLLLRLFMVFVLTKWLLSLLHSYTVCKSPLWGLLQGAKGPNWHCLGPPEVRIRPSMHHLHVCFTSKQICSVFFPQFHALHLNCICMYIYHYHNVTIVISSGQLNINVKINL